jgi:5'-3' exonuclease
MTTRLIETRRPSRLVACWDNDWRPAFRVAAVPEYKAHRVAADGAEEVPDELTPQVPVLIAVLEALGVTRVGVDGAEADDVIGTLAARSTTQTEVVTGDRDLFQVVRADPPVRVLYTARGLSNLEVLGVPEVAAKYGIPGDRYADFAVLRGDPSDGLPGVPGVGDKTAAGLISRYGSLAAVIAADDLSPKLRERIDGAADYLVRAPGVVQVRTDLPVPAHDDSLPIQAADPVALDALVERWGLGRSVRNLQAAIASVTAADPA